MLRWLIIGGIGLTILGLVGVIVALVLLVLELGDKS